MKSLAKKGSLNLFLNARIRAHWYIKETNEKNEQPNGYSFSLAPPTGLEPVTSWLTVMRSTDWAMEEYKCWHLPIFTGRHQPTIVGTTGLNFCVRYGNRWTPGVIDTNLLTCVSISITFIYMQKKRKNAFLKKSGDSWGNRPRTSFLMAPAVTQSPLFTKNSPPDCFLNVQTLSGSIRY